MWRPSHAPWGRINLLFSKKHKCRFAPLILPPGEKCEDPHMPLGAESTSKSRWGRNVKTLTHPLGWNQLLKVDGGRNVKTLTQVLKVDGGRNVKTLTHPLGWNQLLKVDGGRNVKTLTCPLGQNQLLNVDGGRNEDPHMPLWAESTTKRRWGRNVKTLIQLLKVDGGRNVKTITCPLGWNQLLKVDGGRKCEDPHMPLGGRINPCPQLCRLLLYFCRSSHPISHIGHTMAYTGTGNALKNGKLLHF